MNKPSITKSLDMETYNEDDFIIRAIKSQIMTLKPKFDPKYISAQGTIDHEKF